LRAGASGSVTAAVGTTLASTLPSGARQNDIISIWCASVSASNTFSSPGFTAAPPVSGAGGQGSVQLLSKINYGPDPAGATYTVTASSPDVFGQAIFAYGGNDQLIVLDGGALSGAVGASPGTTVSSQSLTITQRGDILAWLGFAIVPAGTITLTAPAGYATEIAQFTSSVTGASQVTMMMADFSGTVPPGATGAVSGTASASGISGAVLLGIPAVQPVPRFLGRPSRTRLAPKLRRSRTVQPVQQTGGLFPVFTRQRPRPVQAPRNWSRGRVFQAPFTQGNRGGPWPVMVITQRFRPLQAAWSASRFRRGRVFAPPGIAQGPQAPRWVPQQVISRPSWRRVAPRLRRSQVFAPAPQKQATGAPWAMFRRVRSRDAEGFRIYRKRVWAPRMSQGPLPAGTPPVMRPRSRPRPWWYRRQGRVFVVTRPKMTFSAAAALSAPSALTATATVTRFATAALSAPSTMSARGTRGVPASAALTAPSTMTVRAQALRIATAALSAPSTMTAHAALARNGSAALSAPSTMTATAFLGSSASLLAPSRMAVAAVATQLASAALSAPSVLTVTATAGPRGREITITPNAIPGVNEAPGTGDFSSVPVTGSTVTAQVEDGIYDAGS